MIITLYRKLNNKSSMMISQTVDLEDSDPLRQRMSVSTHPTLPMMLFSDGFMVTVAKLPENTNCISLMKNLVLFSTNHLREIMNSENLDMTLADAYGMPATSRGEIVGLIIN